MKNADTFPVLSHSLSKELPGGQMQDCRVSVGVGWGRQKG